MIAALATLYGTQVYTEQVAERLEAMINEAQLVENLRTFREGDPYSFEALVRMQSRLTSVGYFSSATVAP